jgi:hypothetical protein
MPLVVEPDGVLRRGHRLPFHEEPDSFDKSDLSPVARDYPEAFEIRIRSFDSTGLRPYPRRFPELTSLPPFDSAGLRLSSSGPSAA